MPPHAAAYRPRLCSADQAAALIPSGAKIAMGMGVSQPPALLAALTARAHAGDVTGIRIYYLLSTAGAGPAVLRHDLRGRITPVSLFHGAIERGLNQQAAAATLPPVDLIPTAFSQAPAVLTQEVGIDTLLTTVSPMDGHGNFSLGTNADYALACARTAQRVILEVNPHMPRAHGNCTIPLADVTAVVEHATPLVEIARAAPRPEDAAIAATIAALARDGDTLQMGIGALPDAVCAALRQHRHLGIHTELITPGLAALMRDGIADNSRKTLHPNRAIYTFAMGDTALYDFLHENPRIEAHPVDYVNNPAIIAQNANMFSVNATLQIDLHGACNSECVNHQQYSAAGGQLDFVRGASASPGGRSIIACYATAANGTLSRIVPHLAGPVTTPRNDVQFVVTEFGCANLRGKTLAERGSALIALAHPDFRESLSRAAHAWKTAA
jgi:itaconate CoA-transferase